MDIQNIRELLQKWLSGNATDQEKKLVEDWYQDQLAQRELTWSESEKENMRAAIESKLLAEINKKSIPVEIIQPAKVRRLSWWAAAASIVILLSAGGYFYYRTTLKNNSAETIQQVAVTDVVAPKNNRATITLASGQKVFLDSAAKGTLASQGNIKVEKLDDGKIAYNGNEQPKNELVFNTLYNPRGSKVISLTLSDGTQVWLNAESSLKYPVAFTGNERKVEITGEAYFEVAHNKSMPFIVKKDAMEVQVLGTHFNINTYEDEKNNKVTLLEGSVKITTGNNSEILKPGEQAIAGEKIKVLSGVDTAIVMAWKNGLFSFDKTDVKFAMNQVARWYDVDIIYDGNVSGFFSGTIARKENASQVLKMLALTGEVQFKIEGKKITVMP